MKWIKLISLLLVLNLAKAQIPNQIFYFADSLEKVESRKLSLMMNSMGFSKNNEYFNRIADGFTLFGAQLNPYLKYSVTDNFSLDVGVYLQQDFGNPGFRLFEPIITFRTKYAGTDIILGTLDGRLNHRLIEPLYDFERLLVDTPEQGVQFIHSTKNHFFDLWVDWETMIYRGDPKQEEVYGGLSFQRDLYFNDTKLYFPFQAIVYHKGGSIDSSPDPLQTMMNFAWGAGFKKEIGRKVNFIEPSVYYAYFRDFSNNRLLDYKDGRGWYANFMVGLNHGIKFMLSYWDANEFISMIGGQLYPSVSSGYKKPYVVKPQRRLMILRYLHDIPIAKNIYLVTRIEPYFDFEKKEFEFAHGLYITFRDQINLWRED